MDEEIKNLSDKIAELLEQRNFRQIKSLINDEMHQDTAQLLEELPEKEMPVVFRLLTKQNAADTFVDPYTGQYGQQPEFEPCSA